MIDRSVNFQYGDNFCLFKGMGCLPSMHRAQAMILRIYYSGVGTLGPSRWISSEAEAFPCFIRFKVIVISLMDKVANIVVYCKF